MQQPTFTFEVVVHFGKIVFVSLHIRFYGNASGPCNKEEEKKKKNK